jgi:hypothetical protein
MNWTRLTRATAKRRFNELAESGDFQPGNLSQVYRSLRDQLKDAIPYYNAWNGTKISYDIQVGITLYRILGEHGFHLRAAADDGVWRHLSLMVVPDIVFRRWKDAAEDRFWRMRSRLWLRAMWWFIHLAWQGNEMATEAAVQGMTTDDVVQLVERPGQGFRVDLCRALIRAASRRQTDLRKFRQLMKLNTANVVMIEPSIQLGGVDGYAKALYARLESTGQFASTD